MGKLTEDLSVFGIGEAIPQQAPEIIQYVSNPPAEKPEDVPGLEKGLSGEVKNYPTISNSAPSNTTVDLLRALSQEDGLTCTFVGPVPIRNWPLVVSTCKESREKYPKDQVIINSNGSDDRPASLWVVRRVLN